MAKDPIGPLQLMAFGFESPDFKGKIADEIKRLNDKNVLRLVDGIAVQKDKNGEVMAIEASQLSLEQASRYGAIIGALIGIGTGDKNIAKATSRAVADNFSERYEYGLDKDDIKDITDNMPDDSAAILLLVEHVWAIPLRDSIRGAGGVLLAQDFLSPEALISLGQGIKAGAAA